MEADVGNARTVVAVVAVVLFNLPILFAAWRLLGVANFSSALREKGPSGELDGPVSYSRVTGMIGAVVVASLFWMMSNVTIWTALTAPGDLAGILSSVSNLFYVGAALFVPYAFNQLKTLLQ